MDKQKPKLTALHEKAGIEPPEAVSKSGAQQIIRLRTKNPDPADLVKGIVTGDITSLSRAITLVESTNPSHSEKAQDVINHCLPHASESIRIGITGVPGVGKSTFIEAFGTHLTALGKKVAVLAVDPSSTISHGSILGDKTRMEELVRDSNAFIRPSASGETLGGVARKTRESIILCEAAGFNIIIIETVGVGQSETAVHSMVDFFLLLKISGAGDELQGIKRGIMEMADLVVINKADGDNIKGAALAKTEFHRALHLFPAKKSGWSPTAVTASAINKTGVNEIWQTITNYLLLTKGNGYFNDKRRDQNQYWMLETINSRLMENFYNNPKVSAILEQQKKAVQINEISPFAAAQLLLNSYFKKE